MDDIKAKQQVVDKIKEATSVLVTVSKSPSVDALSAALGLALLIDKLDKHATAVFSGETPPAISFLQPEKTFEHTTDSLRDFIVALDKEKADHLRLKVEGDMAKIYITPYRTTITSDDLTFSQGDFHVELVIALGVDDQDHLDAALEAHGQILHDAPVITITSGEQTSKLGGIDWHDSRASSLSEMVTGLGEALKDKDRLTDQQIATALLTGIVAATDRFSNPHTTSAAMTIAAQLMADGADQQLIAAELEKPQTVSGKPAATHDKPVKVKKGTHPDNMNIVHGETLAEMDARVNAHHDSAEKAEKSEAKPDETPKNDHSDIPQQNDGRIGEVHAKQDAMLNADTPSLGGTLNATTDRAEEDSRRELDGDKNKKILTHSYVGDSGNAPAMSGATVDENGEETTIDPLSVPEPTPEASEPEPAPAPVEEVHSAYALDPEPEPAAEPVVAPEAPAAPVEDEKPAEESVPKAAEPVVPPTPPAPADLGLPMPPPLPDFSTMNHGALNSAYAPEPMPQTAPPERLGDILAPEPVSEPEQVPPVTPTPSTPPTPPSNDPGQFKIPGQP